MTEKMINCGQFAKLAGISLSKMYNLTRYHSFCLPKPVINRMDINGKLHRCWKESDVIEFLAHTSLKEIQYNDIKACDNRHEKLLVTLFVNRERPKIDRDAMILKYPCHRSTQHLKEHDAPRLRQFDNNFGKYL